jgi:hypothetical protein
MVASVARARAEVARVATIEVGAPGHLILNADVCQCTGKLESGEIQMLLSDVSDLKVGF